MTTHAMETMAGFRFVRLTSDRCSVAVVPSLGAKMISLVDLRTNREWMWRPPGPLHLWRNEEGASFLESTFVGADECLPTIKPCRWRGRELSDHGEVWSADWTLDEKQLSEGVIHTSVRLPRSPFLFQRVLRLDGNRIRLEYELTNIGSEPESWLWALHPLLSYHPGDRLELPAEVSRVRVYLASQPDVSQGDILAWPEPGPCTDLRKLELEGESAYLKSFPQPLHHGRARIMNSATGDALAFHWDLQANPCLGLWLTRGGFKGWHHAAIEPTNLASDSLEEASRDYSLPFLAPGGTQAWWVELLVG